MFCLIRLWNDSTSLESWEAVGIFQTEEIRTGLTGKYHIGHVVRSNLYAVWNLKLEPKAIIEPITEAEYYTYLEFEIFPKPLDFPDLKV
jgi:hypothetical protein